MATLEKQYPFNTSYPAAAGPFKKGSKGKDVKLIQSQLKLYYAVRGLELPQKVSLLPQDDNQPGYGVFGTATDTAVRTFQTTAEIKIDGLVGPNTWKVLFSPPPEEEPAPPEEPPVGEKEIKYLEYVILEGLVTDDFGDPIGGAKVQYSGLEKGPDGKVVEEPVPSGDFTEIPSPLETITVPKQILITGKTATDQASFGIFQLIIPKAQFDTTSGKVTIIPQDKGAKTKVSTKTIGKINTSNPVVFSVENIFISQNTLKAFGYEDYTTVSKEGLPVSNQSTLYDLGIIKLSALTRALKEIQRYTIDQINDYTGKFNEFKESLKLPSSVNLQKRFNQFIEENKEKLLPIVLQLLQEFGPQILQLVMTKADQKVIDANKTCPDEQKIKEIIARRNRLIRALNAMYSFVLIGQRVSTGLIIAVEAAKIGLAAYNANPFPVPPGADSAKNSLKLKLEIYGVAANGLNQVFAILGYVLGILLDNLKTLDFLIQGCSKDLEIPFEDINEEIINLSDSQLTTQMQRNEIGYKGFTLKVELSGKDVANYQSRIGVAYDRSGVAVLRTPASFTSVPDLLLKQLQLRIDEENLKAD